MTFETFKIVYFSSGILGVALAYWYVRKQRAELTSPAAISVLATFAFVAFYLEASEQIPDTLVEEHLLRAFTHLRKDLILSLSNAFMWCIVPFAIGLAVKKRLGEVFVWILFALLVLLKTYFDDYFLIGLYPESFTHSIEWGDVLFGWSLVYCALAFFVTKGSKLFHENEPGSRIWRKQ